MIHDDPNRVAAAGLRFRLAAPGLLLLMSHYVATRGEMFFTKKGRRRESRLEQKKERKGLHIHPSSCCVSGAGLVGEFLRPGRASYHPGRLPSSFIVTRRRLLLPFGTHVTTSSCTAAIYLYIYTGGAPFDGRILPSASRNYFIRTRRQK